jgi:zinc transport system substrate-binding protein
MRRGTLSLWAAVLSVATAAWAAAAADAPVAAPALRLTATVHPVACILEEIGGERVTVHRLLPSGASPHTFEPRPADVRAAENAAALFYVDDSLDGWAAKMPAQRRIALFALVPAELRLTYPYSDGGAAPVRRAATAQAAAPHHEHGPDCDHGPAAEHVHGPDCDHGHEAGSLDAHFWPDPLAVKAIAPLVARELSRLDPDGADVYARNATRFAAALDALHVEVTETLAPVRGRAVFLYHPSLLYLLERYGLRYAGSIEMFPGKEPTPRYLATLMERFRAADGRAIFAEPQLSRRAAEVVARELKVKVGLLDPMGGTEQTRTYADLIRFNARALAEALR